MKKLIILLFITTAFTSCKNEAKTEPKADIVNTDNPDKTIKQSDGLTLLKGDFIYYSDAAVLQTHKEVYGVIIDAKMLELEAQAKQHKNEPTDMVKVTIRAQISPKPQGEEGWAFRVAIKEIIKVEKINPEKNDVIKLGS